MSTSSKKTTSLDGSSKPTTVPKPSTRDKSKSSKPEPSTKTSGASVSPSTSKSRKSKTSSSNDKSKNTNKSSQKTTIVTPPPPAPKASNKPPTPKTITKTHESHPHPLEKANRRHTYKCDGCKLQGVGERYVCTPCKYKLHVDCISARSTTKFEGYKCKFLQKPLKCRTINCKHGKYHRSCDACGMTIEGFVYHCEENDMDFHPSCTKLKKEIRIEDVIFRLQKEGSFKCLCCQKKKLEGTTKNVRGWTYVSNHNYTFHVHCLMEMSMKFPSENTNSKGASSSSSSSSSSSTLAFENLNIPKNSMKTIVKGSGNIGGNSLKVLEIFLKVVLPLLMGAHPATLILSLAAVGVKQLVNLLL